jgi:hypothetical protein
LTTEPVETSHIAIFGANLIQRLPCGLYWFFGMAKTRDERASKPPTQPHTRLSPQKDLKIHQNIGEKKEPKRTKQNTLW